MAGGSQLALLDDAQKGNRWERNLGRQRTLRTGNSADLFVVFEERSPGNLFPSWMQAYRAVLAACLYGISCSGSARAADPRAAARPLLLPLRGAALRIAIGTDKMGLRTCPISLSPRCVRRLDPFTQAVGDGQTQAVVPLFARAGYFGRVKARIKCSAARQVVWPIPVSGTGNPT